MKSLVLIFSFLLSINCVSMAQNNIVDTNPTASIFIIDYSTGQEVLANFDAAILFKNALIDLVSNTGVAKIQSKLSPGRKTIVITQMDPQTNGNAYQVVQQSKFLGQTGTIYTFVYSVDQNILSYYDPQSRGYANVAIQGLNVNNLNNCYTLGKFNVQQVQPAPVAPPQAVINTSQQAQAVTVVDENAPVDDDVTANTVPPALSDYEQPECPVDGYLWQPGFWAYGRDVSGYYWVPGAWVAPPSVGVLWTPPYWGYEGNLYVFHRGYWGNTIGFYGGVNYGFGYGGVGFVGGDWHEGHFRYNTAILRVNERVVHNVYIDRTVIYTGERNRSSFNGRGGVIYKANEREMAAMRERHVMATPEQIRNQRAARSDRSQFAAANGGKPGTFASARALEPKPGMNNGGARPGNNNSPQAGRPGINGTPNTNATPGQPNNNNTQGGRPGMNNANPNTAQGQQNVNGAQGGRAGMNNTPNATSGTPAANGGQATNAASAAQGTNAAPGGNRQGGATAPGAQGANAASGARPGVPSVPGAPGARQGVPGATGKTGPKTQQHTHNESKPAKSEKP